MDSQPLLDAIDLDDEEQVLTLLKSSSNGELCSSMVNSKLWLPGWSGFTLLLWAAQRGHVHATSLLLKCGAHIDAADDAGDTALHHAARFRRTAIFEQLMAAAPPHFDFNARNKDGNTPLHLAAESGAAKIVQLLACATSCRLNDQNRNGDTALHQAARYGNILALKLILTFDSIDSSLRNHDGNTPLHLAVMRGKRVSVEALLICKHAASCLDARNKARLTPLLLACSSNTACQMMSHRGHAAGKDTAIKEIVELLLQEGADVNARDMDGNTALHLAARNGNADVITALLSSSEGQSSQASAEGDAESMSSAPPKDQHLSVRSKKKADFLTWITHAIEAEQLDDITPSPNRKEYFYSTDWRIERVPSSPDARVNLPNKEGETALHLAAHHGHRAAAETLLDLRASVNKLNKYLDTPLDYAFKAKHDTIVALLIERGAELSNRIKHSLVELALGEVANTNQLVPKPRSWDFQDLYLLHTIAIAGRTKILEALVEVEGMDVNARNEWKQTPLHCASILGKTAVIMSLVKMQEVRANAEDRKGKTALQYAVECKHSEVEKLLLERVDVKESMDRLYRDRQVYVDAANAVLVGAALIGGVTYSGWLQPPLGYNDQGYASMSSLGVRIFWVFNSLSFCFAMCTVLAGAGAILPRPDVYIASVVREVRRVLALAAFLMALSILSVLVAFAAAGFAVVQKPGERIGPILMGAAITPGISIAFGLMFWFIAKMWALLPQWCMRWLYVFLHCDDGWPSAVPLSHHNHRNMQYQHHSPSTSSSPSHLLNDIVHIS